MDKCPEEWLEMVPVSRRVNKVENDDAALMDAVATPEGVVPRSPKKASANDEAQGSLF